MPTALQKKTKKSLTVATTVSCFWTRLQQIKSKYSTWIKINKPQKVTQLSKHYIAMHVLALVTFHVTVDLMFSANT